MGSFPTFLFYPYLKNTMLQQTTVVIGIGSLNSDLTSTTALLADIERGP